ncbi:MAG TPA: pentapeptide repeat-containing protein [Pyrinomonadaceae bacterium]|nr:pentapeptide repeat-containing protein [Pyrinomonadaceae bacterium]
MFDLTSSNPQGSFVCGCPESMRSACTGEGFFRKHESSEYCVLHYSAADKKDEFKEALKRKLAVNNYDFSGVWFPEEVSFYNQRIPEQANFVGAVFNEEVSFIRAVFDGEANFNNVTFKGSALFQASTFASQAHFSRAIFQRGARFRAAEFNGLANFSSAVFTEQVEFNHVVFNKPAIFDGSTFKAAGEFHSSEFRSGGNFSQVIFAAAARFSSAKFNERTNFIGTTFEKKADFTSSRFEAEADFTSAAFLDQATFAGTVLNKVFGKQSSLNLQHARIETPHRILFHTIFLLPHWFINVNSRGFDFANVEWGDRSIQEDIDVLGKKGVSPPHRLLQIAYRNLALNAEENHRYVEASDFRYKSMESQRLEPRQGRWSWNLGGVYWLASGYGERVLRAFTVLMGIWLLAGLLYMYVGFARGQPAPGCETNVIRNEPDKTGEPLNWKHALTYSLGVMTLQRPEPPPVTLSAKSVVLLETVLGPVQAALLALAIRRQFMR